MKNATIAKLSQAVSDLYAAALQVTERRGPALSMSAEEEGRAELPREWLAHLAVKTNHFRAASQFRKSVDDSESNRYGDEIGRLQAAEADVKKALDAAKRGVSDSISLDLKSLQGVIATNLARANKDNDLIYLEAVPSAANLAKIAPAVMVKPTLPKEIEDPIQFLRPAPPPAFGAPLFQALVPYGVHVAISVYEDRKETLVRDEISNQKTELDALASSTLQSLGLPGSLQAQDQASAIPPSLLRKGEEIRLDGGVPKLKRLAADVAKIASTDDAMLRETLAILDQEATEDAQVRSTFSEQRWTRPASEEAAHQYRSQHAEFRRTLDQAMRSDAIVREKLSDWEDAIDVLAGGESALNAFIPKPSFSGAARGGARGPVGDSARALRLALEELDDLQDSRASCVAEAKALGKADDIRPAAMREAGRLAAAGSGAGGNLVVQASEFESLFEEELGKYARFTNEMRNNAAAQEDKLEQIAVSGGSCSLETRVWDPHDFSTHLQTLNKAFVESRSVDTATKRREGALQNLDLAFAKYRELLSNLVEGLNVSSTSHRRLKSGERRRWC